MKNLNYFEIKKILKRVQKVIYNLLKYINNKKKNRQISAIFAFKKYAILQTVSNSL